MKLRWKQALEIETKAQQILVQQEIAGIQFDIEAAKNLVAFIQEEQDRIYNDIRPKLSYEVEICEVKDKDGYGHVRKIFTTKGEYTAQVMRWLSNVYDESDIEALVLSRFVAGPYSRINFVEPEFSKREKLANQLIRFGWKPELFTATGIPMLTIKGIPVDSLEKIEGDIGKGLAKWFTLGHRKGVIEGWIKNIREDGRLTPYCTGGTTNTFRRKHKCVNYCGAL